MTKYSAKCVLVQDGDTFKTALNNWVRLANVCAPDKGSYDYIIAKAALEDLILGESIVYEEVGKSYGRLVCEVWVGDTHVNRYMRNQGYTC